MENRTLPIVHSIALYRIIDRILFIKTEEEEGGPVERELPFNVRYKLQRNQGMLLKDYAFYESERGKLVKQLGTEENGRMVVKEDHIEEFKQELTKIIRMEVDHPLKGLTPDEMDSIKGDIAVSGEEMSLFIAYMVDDPEFVEDLNSDITVKPEEDDGKNGTPAE